MTNNVVKEFTDYIENCAFNGNKVDIYKMLDLYKATKPLMHNVNNHTMDWAAWGYALRRLPISSLDLRVSTSWKICVNVEVYQNLPKSNEYPCVNNGCVVDNKWVPNPAANGYDYWLYSFTKMFKKKRTNVVISRGGFTDTFQIISLLCIHIVESIKYITNIVNVTKREVDEFVNLYNTQWIKAKYFTDTDKDPKSVLLTMCKNIHKLEIDYLTQKNIKIDWNNTRVSQYWERSLKEKFANFVSHKMCELDFDNLVKNNGISIDIFQIGMDNIYMRLFIKEIHIFKLIIDEWVRINKVTTFYEKYYKNKKGWKENTDTHLYSKISKFCRSDQYNNFCKLYWPEQVENNVDDNITYGIQKHVIEMKEFENCHSFSNKLTVYFVNIEKIANGHYYDKSINFPDNIKNKYLILINCVYGDQSGHAWKALIDAFGTSIHSGTFIGKCGGLNLMKKHNTMDREQVIIAKGYPHFSDNITSELGNYRDKRINKKYLSNYFKNEITNVPQIWYGDVVTVTNVIIQSYESLAEWERKGAVGCEMEGTYIWNCIHEGLVNKKLNAKFKFTGLYYISDLPLGTEKLYSEVVDMHEGQPIVFALFRATLNNVFSRYATNKKTQKRVPSKRRITKKQHYIKTNFEL